MNGDESSGSDPDLRALLEEIAATGGDPPEHGLDRVASLRRRRTRHRRGAVAATMALAVVALASWSWLGDPGGRDHDVSAAGESDPGVGSGAAVEVPDVLALGCSSRGIQVPVASVRPQEDGLHMLVQNDGNHPVEVWVAATGGPDLWDSGPVEVDPGRKEIVQPVAPGNLTVGCRASARAEERRWVDLVDVDGLYTPPELSCPEEERSESGEAAEIPLTGSYAVAVREGLGDHLLEEDEVGPLDGYPEQRFTVRSPSPIVRVVREGDTVAFVGLEAAEAPARWTSVRLLEACEGFLADGESPTGGDGGPAEGSSDAAG